MGLTEGWFRSILGEVLPGTSPRDFSELFAFANSVNLTDVQAGFPDETPPDKLPRKWNLGNKIGSLIVTFRQANGLDPADLERFKQLLRFAFEMKTGRRCSMKGHKAYCRPIMECSAPTRMKRSGKE